MLGLGERGRLDRRGYKLAAVNKRLSLAKWGSLDYQKHTGGRLAEHK
jgi:hypothetical protein